MNKPVLYLLLIVALAAATYLVIRDPSASDVPSPDGTDGPAAVSPPEDAEAVAPDDGPANAQVGTPIPREKLATPEEQARALQEFIDKMPDEEKRAKPDDIPMEWWAMQAARFYQNLEQIGDIEFYGIVVDDQGEPLPDVNIRGSVVSCYPSMAAWHAAREPGPHVFTALDIKTDPDGRFSVQGMTGIRLIFSEFNLDGYWIEEGTKNGFSFVPDDVPGYRPDKRHEPDPDNPVVFVLRRVQVEE